MRCLAAVTERQSAARTVSRRQTRRIRARGKFAYHSRSLAKIVSGGRGQRGSVEHDCEVFPREFLRPHATENRSERIRPRPREIATDSRGGAVALDHGANLSVPAEGQRGACAASVRV